MNIIGSTAAPRLSVVLQDSKRYLPLANGIFYTTSLLNTDGR